MNEITTTKLLQELSFSTEAPIGKEGKPPVTTQKNTMPAAGALSNSTTTSTNISESKPALVIVLLSDQDGNPLLPPPGTDIGTLTIYLESLQAKVNDQGLEGLQKRLENKQASIKANLNEQLHKIDEQHKKAEEAAKKAKKNWLANLLGKIFGVILMVAALIATVATAGAATPLLVASTVLTVALIAQTISDIVIMGINKIREEQGKDPIPNLGELMAKGITALLVALGADKEKATMAGAILSGIVIMAITIVSAVLSFQVAKAAVDIPLLLTRILKVTQAAASAAQGLATTTQSVFSIQIAKLQKQLAEITAALEELRANRENMEKLSEELQKVIEQLFDVISGWTAKTADIVATSGEGMKSLIRQIGGNQTPNYS